MNDTPVVLTLIRRFANQTEAEQWLAANTLGPDDVASIVPAEVFDAEATNGAPNA